MSIKEILEKIKPFYFLAMLLLVAGIFFTLGQLFNLNQAKMPIKIEYPNTSQTSTVLTSVSTSTTAMPVNSSPSVPSDGAVIGSKSGKKYYFPWCGTVKRIKPENQVHFSSIEEAKKAGFVAGGNCKGLK